MQRHALRLLGTAARMRRAAHAVQEDSAGVPAPPTEASPVAEGSTNARIAALHGSANVAQAGEVGEKFYISTAINYTNGPPHCGHAYEAVIADVLARYHRLCGRDVLFVTGTDEHGQKIANRAQDCSISPQQYCDRWAEEFQRLNERLLISNNLYVRTTDAHHAAACQELWRRCEEAGDIYLDEYTGWYNEREEAFVTETEAEKAGYVDAAGSGAPLRKVSEKCYFFRLGRYHGRLVEHIESNPGFIQPEQSRQQVLEMLRQPGDTGKLQDLCISRTAFSWGVPTPEGTEPGHVMYVWFDALTNYLSALGGCSSAASGVEKWWPADVQLVGKDIVRFHCIYWPAMLWSAGLPAPTTVLSHGFVNDAEGKKMSKSIGNVVCPREVLTTFPPDTLRYHLCAETPCGSDLKFSGEAVAVTHNQILADTLGNLLQRAVLLCHKFAGGVVPAVPEAVPQSGEGHVPHPFNLTVVLQQYHAAFVRYDQKAALFHAMEACREANKWLTDLAPWKMEAGSAAQSLAIRYLLEAAYALSHLLAPFTPMAASALFARLGTPGASFDSLTPGFRTLEAGTVLSPSPLWDSSGDKTLFPKVMTEAEKAGGGGGGGGGPKWTPGQGKKKQKQRRGEEGGVEGSRAGEERGKKKKKKQKQQQREDGVEGGSLKAGSA